MSRDRLYRPERPEGSRPLVLICGAEGHTRGHWEAPLLWLAHGPWTFLADPLTESKLITVKSCPTFQNSKTTGQRSPRPFPAGTATASGPSSLALEAGHVPVTVFALCLRCLPSQSRVLACKLRLKFIFT